MRKEDILRKDIVMASQMITAAGFRLGLQMMIGLPGDSLDKAIFTAKKIIELRAVETRIYPCWSSADKMAEWYEQGTYKTLILGKPLTAERVAPCI